jgi:thiol-disulfide isomerase/thioredoxin
VLRASYVLGLTLLALLVVAQWAACHRRAATPLPDTDRPLTLLDGPTLAGPPVDVAALAGKVVVVNFWSPSCVPCQREAPGLQAVADELAPRGLALVTVMLEGTKAGAETFVRTAGLTAPVVLGNDEIAGHFRVAVYPWTVVLGRDGRPVTALRGGRAANELRSVFSDVL